MYVVIKQILYIVPNKRRDETKILFEEKKRII